MLTPFTTAKSFFKSSVMRVCTFTLGFPFPPLTMDNNRKEVKTEAFSDGERLKSASPK